MLCHVAERRFGTYSPACGVRAGSVDGTGTACLGLHAAKVRSWCSMVWNRRFIGDIALIQYTTFPCDKGIDIAGSFNIKERMSNWGYKKWKLWVVGYIRTGRYLFGVHLVCWSGNALRVWSSLRCFDPEGWVPNRMLCRTWAPGGDAMLATGEIKNDLGSSEDGDDVARYGDVRTCLMLKSKGRRTLMSISDRLKWSPMR